MDPVRLDAKESTPPEWFGVREAGRVPARRSHDGAAPAAPASSNPTAHASATASGARRWWHRGARFVRDAIVGLSIVAAIPFAVIGTRGEHALLRDVSGLRERIADVERLRPLMIAQDVSITPAEAGTLLHRLETVRRVSQFPMHAVAPAPERPWATTTPVDLFAGLRAEGNEATLAGAIVTAAPRGFTEREMAYLRAVAEAPIWHEVERVASAPAVDVIGGRFVLPFREDAQAYAMPIMSFADTKQLAYAGVARAAYYVATGHPERAEVALRTLVSYGFVLIDNGSHVMDALIGRVVVGIAQNGLHQLYMLTGNTSGTAMTAPIPTRPVAADEKVIDADAAYARMLREASDPTMPRTVRLEVLHRLTFATCASVGGVLSGPSPAVQDAFANARQNLARYPSERAYLELMYHGVERLPLDEPSGLGARVIMGAASATSAVLGNPRVAACTRIVLAN